jgi:hypothetical protein
MSKRTSDVGLKGRATMMSGDAGLKESRVSVLGYE